MIEVLNDMSEGVAGIRVSGRLKGEDLREFKPPWRGCSTPTRSDWSRT
jgi:hypothetical protein